MINKPLIHFLTKSQFEKSLKSGDLTDTSLCFIKNTLEIYTHGLLYSCHFGDNLNVDKIEADKDLKSLKVTFANNGTTLISLTEILDGDYASITKVKELEDLINTKLDKIISSYNSNTETWALENL